jgi:hypothetical protein
MRIHLKSIATLALLAAALAPTQRAAADLIGRQITGSAYYTAPTINAFNSDLNNTPTVATVSATAVEFVDTDSFGISFQADVRADRIYFTSINPVVANSLAAHTVTLTGLYFGGNTAVTGGLVLQSSHPGGANAVTVTPLAPGSLKVVIPGGSIPANGVQLTILQLNTTMGNDSCANAIPIPLGVTPFSTTGATTDGIAHFVGCNYFNGPNIAKDIWFTHTAAATGSLKVSTCGSFFDTELAVYTAGTCPGNDTTLIDCNDDDGFCNLGNSSVSVFVTVGQTYLIRVGGFDGTQASGSGTLTLTATTTGACCNVTTGACYPRTAADCLNSGLRFDGLGAVCSAMACRACPADFDASGALAVADIFAFLNSWFAGCP